MHFIQANIFTVRVS